MCEELKLERFDNSSWGFRLTGGLDFGTPLTVIKVTGGSVAELSGVEVGDLIVEINGHSAKHFTHSDAQNCITDSGDRLTLSVIRGSEVTPPGPTPLRGMTPMIGQDQSYSTANETTLLQDLKGKLEEIRNESLLRSCESQTDIRQMVDHSETPDASEPIGQIGEHGGLMVNPNKVSDLELDELLTGNEEVLDQGVLGINFQKYHPQVDFIRKSEVFKVLQSENVYKEVPEEVQLEKEPTKRFSTFLMKPKPPSSPKLQWPYWHYPKPPRYLPKERSKDGDDPKRRVPKEKPEEGHSVLWLFLEESGENVIAERWGTEEEERLNLSRNESRQDDDKSTTSIDKGKTSGHNTPAQNSDLSSRPQTGQNKPIIEEVKETTIVNEMTMESENTEVTTTTEKEIVDESDYYEEIVQSGNEENEEGAALKSQLADIQAKIALLEDGAPGDLQTQLVRIHEQLSKIVELKTTVKKETKVTVKEEITISETTGEPSEGAGNQCKGNGCEEQHITESYMYTETNEDPDNASEHENGDYTEETKFEEDGEDELPGNGVKGEDIMEEFKAGEYEVCEAPPPPPVKKLPKQPLTPQKRPIVLPGGRMWYQPKDAMFEEFYQGILVEQADVLVGSTGGVNFRKYVPPKFDVDNSAVCKLIHEIEDKTKGTEKMLDAHCYQEPISKRHFYLATLKAPAPVGNVELGEMECNA